MVKFSVKLYIYTQLLKVNFIVFIAKTEYFTNMKTTADYI